MLIFTSYIAQNSPSQIATSKINSLSKISYDKTDISFFQNKKTETLMFRDPLIKDTLPLGKQYSSTYRIDYYEWGKILGISKLTSTLEYGVLFNGEIGNYIHSISDSTFSMYFDSSGNPISRKEATKIRLMLIIFL